MHPDSLQMYEMAKGLIAEANKTCDGLSLTILIVLVFGMGLFGWINWKANNATNKALIDTANKATETAKEERKYYDEREERRLEREAKQDAIKAQWAKEVKGDVHKIAGDMGEMKNTLAEFSGRMTLHESQIRENSRRIEKMEDKVNQLEQRK